jgi:hypothetical protein
MDARDGEAAEKTRELAALPFTRPPKHPISPAPVIGTSSHHDATLSPGPSL